MNIDDDNHIKSCRLEEVDIPQNLELLNKWTIPKVDIKLIYDYGWFDKLSTKQVVKTQLNPPIILGTPFINAIYPFSKLNAKGFTANYNGNTINFDFITEPVTRDINSLIHLKQKHIESLQMEIYSLNISESLQAPKVQEKIKLISGKITSDICADHPNAFWNRKKHIVTLPYEDSFNEENIPTKSRPCQIIFAIIGPSAIPTGYHPHGHPDLDLS